MKKYNWLLILLLLTLVGVSIFLIVYFTTKKSNGGITGGPSPRELYDYDPEPIRNYKPQIFENFLTHEECDYIIEKAKPNMKRSIVMGNTGDEVQSYRTSTQLFIDQKKDPKLLDIAKRMSNVTGKPVKNQENMQVLKYEPGQQYKEHYDACGENSPYCISDSKMGGKRWNTLFIYLNDVDSGGETYFPKLDLKVKPRKGRALLFYNLEEDLWTQHHLSMHAGLPLVKGEKWAMNVWSRCGEYK